MIQRRVDAALLMRDGFTGRVFADGAGTRCLLDGQPLKSPIWKKEGYLILTDLAPGAHELRVCRDGYREEVVPLETGGAPVEDTVALKPGERYRFPAETASIVLTLCRGKERASGEQIWIGAASQRCKLKLAQDKAGDGDVQAHLFCDGNAALLPIPGHFLLMDKKEPELVYLRSFHDETAKFAQALRHTHSRGVELVPMQAYRADGDGVVRVLLREPGARVGFCGKQIFQAELQAGEQSAEWKLEG